LLARSEPLVAMRVPCLTVPFHLRATHAGAVVRRADLLGCEVDDHLEAALEKEDGVRRVTRPGVRRSAEHPLREIGDGAEGLLRDIFVRIELETLKRKIGRDLARTTF